VENDETNAHTIDALSACPLIYARWIADSDIYRKRCESDEGAQTLSDDNGRMLPMLRVVCEKRKIAIRVTRIKRELEQLPHK